MAAEAQGGASTPQEKVSEPAPVQQQQTEKRDDNLRFIQPQPLREEQVQNAVNFLSHPKVKGSPIVYRRSFLERKGLTKEEIDEAFRRVPDPPPSTAPSQEVVKPAPAAPTSHTQAIQASTQPIVVPRKGARWTQIVLAIGVLSAAGAGAAVLTKNYVYPKLRTWLRHMILEEEGDPHKSKSIADVEASKIASATASAAAATASAAAAAAEMAAVAREILAFRTEDRRYMDGVLKSLEARNQEIKATLDALFELQQKTRPLVSTANGDGSVNKGYLNGVEDVKLSNGTNGPVWPKNDRSARPSTSSPTGTATNAPPAPASYMEVLAMVERGEKPPGIRDVNDKPPNANQLPSDSLLQPKVKPWESTASQANAGPWWRQKASAPETQSVRITEIEERGQGTSSSSGRGWVPPPAPKPILPGVDAAIRHRPPPSSPPSSPPHNQSASASYHEMNGSMGTTEDKSVDPSGSGDGIMEEVVTKEATSSSQQQEQQQQQEQDEQQQLLQQDEVDASA